MGPIGKKILKYKPINQNQEEYQTHMKRISVAKTECLHIELPPWAEISHSGSFLIMFYLLTLKNFSSLLVKSDNGVVCALYFSIKSDGFTVMCMCGTNTKLRGFNHKWHTTIDEIQTWTA